MATQFERNDVQPTVYVDAQVADLFERDKYMVKVTIYFFFT